MNRDARRRVVLLGATGSIGTQALDVIRAHPGRFEVLALAAGTDARALAQQAEEFGVTQLAVADADAARSLRERLPDAVVRDGAAGIAEIAALPDADVVLNAVTGARGLAPTLAALGAGHVVALANKESLIVGGDLVIAAAEQAGGRDRQLVPVDSEHSAIAQCLRSGAASEIGRVVLTASGGPFRGRTREDLAGVTVAEALAHPTWDMGPVITVNSATLMNKGLELIEAHLLFDLPWDRLDVVVHPQSIVHSLVEFVDGSTIAQLSPPDMRLPIQLALAWPERLPHAFAAMDWTRAETLTFEPVDRTTFRALSLAEEAGRRAGTFPCVLNAANEQAVDAFLAGRIRLPRIIDVVEDVLEAHAAGNPPAPRDVDDVVAADGWARAEADRRLEEGTR
ncbi:MAG: 1-deoxy-D-xylulose-5-phosphate reductoisomerase [Actinobacteria bacterium]|nr:1-deoxy-D-xylulose-5-phosphate reductoisomerase [Actinomycetota bacterium]